MVPFPLRDGDYEYNRRKISSAKSRLYHNPDFHGILTPPMKENVKKSNLIDKISYSLWHGPRSKSLGDSIAYGIPNYLIRLVLTGKGADLDRIRYYTHTFSLPNWYDVPGGRIWKKSSQRMKEFETLDREKAWQILQRDLKGKIPDNLLTTLKTMFPDILQAGLIFKKITSEYMKRYNAEDEIEAFNQLAEHPAPEAVILDYISPEDLKALHKLHVKLYHALPGFFEKKSGVEHLLKIKGVPEEEIKKMEEEALAELRGMEPSKQAPARKITGEYKGVPLEEGDRVETYPGTNIEVIRKADGRIIVLPHKSVKEIPYLKGPDRQKWLPQTVMTFAGNVIGNADFDRLSREIDQTVDMLNKIVELAKSGKSPKELAEDVERLRKSSGEMGNRFFGRYITNWFRKYDKYPQMEGYSRDHVVAEYSTGIITLLEMKKILQDIKKNPEKYGINLKKLDQQDIKEWIKLQDLLEEKLRHVQGFYHKHKR